jgi:S-adenosylmethionine decarboxylase
VSNGRHLILDLYDCDPDILDDYEELQRLLEASLVMAKANVLRIIGEKFKPQGVTLLALLSESHASIHTWPEIGYAAIDLYTCGDVTETHRAAEFLSEKLKAGTIEQKEVKRSVTPPICV